MTLPKTPEQWTKNYVGIPFVDKGRDRKGLDCWGLVWLVYKEMLNIQLPSYTNRYLTAEEMDEVARVIRSELDPWREITDVQMFDVLRMRITGRDAHVAIIVANNWMLHTLPKLDTFLTRYDTLNWKNRVLGSYRYEVVSNAT